MPQDNARYTEEEKFEETDLTKSKAGMIPEEDGCLAKVLKSKNV